MALMAPTQTSPAPHHTDPKPRFRAAGICRFLPGCGNSLKNTCSPPNGRTSTQPGILRPFSVDINKPAAAFHTTLFPEKVDHDNLTPFSLSPPS